MPASRRSSFRRRLGPAHRPTQRRRARPRRCRRCRATRARRDFHLMEQHGIEDSPCQDGGRVAGREAQRDASGGMDERHGDSRLGLSGRAGDEQAGRDRHAAAGQPAAQPLARPGQPAPDRDLRDAEPMRRRGVGQPLEVAEHDRGAQPLGQAVDLLVEDLPVGVVLAGRVLSGARSAMWSAEPAASRRAPPGASRHAMGHPEEPARDRAAPPDRPRPTGQDEEDRLEGILRIMRVAEDGPTDPQHHRPVPAHQLLEGRLRGFIAPRGTGPGAARRTSSRPPLG